MFTNYMYVLKNLCHEYIYIYIHTKMQIFQTLQRYPVSPLLLSLFFIFKGYSSSSSSGSVGQKKTRQHRPACGISSEQGFHQWGSSPSLFVGATLFPAALLSCAQQSFSPVRPFSVQQSEQLDGAILSCAVAHGRSPFLSFGMEVVSLLRGAAFNHSLFQSKSKFIRLFSSLDFLLISNFLFSLNHTGSSYLK